MTATSDVSTRRRVKLYMLNDERQWDDKGTGHVSATLVEQSIMALVVISETDGSHLLESKIQHDTAYQKQQETLIVWSEGDNMDLALSFQEKTGCDDIWEKICSVQGKDPSVEITQDLIDDADDNEDMEIESSSGINSHGFEFPPCDLDHLAEISEMFTNVINYPIQRERLATALERTQYMKQLVDVFHKAEELEDIKSLNNIYEIMRAIIQFNRRSLYELIFSEEYIMEIVGMLEYTPTKRVKHREFLTKSANFKEVLPMTVVLKNKIHQTYRVQYIQDSCLPPPSLFDDNGGPSLNSFVYLNKIDIITKLQEDSQFMTHLFNGLLNTELSIENHKDLLLLLKDFCVIVNSLQASQKESFFVALNVNRALKSIFVSFRIANDKIKVICVEILQIFVDNQATAVREFFINNSRENENESLHINVLIDQLINDQDPELSNGFIIMGMLKVLFDPESMVNTNQRNEKQEFLNFLYKHSMTHLTQPLVDVTTDNELRFDDYHTAMVMHAIMELLSYCVEFHSYHMKNFLFHHDTLSKVVTLFKSQHKMLVLASLRVVRKFIGSREEFNYRYIIKNNILHQIVLLLDNNRKYNMLNSSILELFEFIRNENIACLINNIIEINWSMLQHHDYTNIFKLMKARYDQNVDKSAKKNNGSNMVSLMNATPSSKIRRGSTMDDDEEQWYDQDDTDEDEVLSTSTPSSTYPVTSPLFIERFSRNSISKESDVSTFKVSSGKYNRDQNIPINIKTTNFTLGTVSSSTTVDNGDCVVYNTPSVNGETASTEVSDSTTSHISSSKVILGNSNMAGLVDYTSDDENDDDDANEVTPNSSNNVRKDTSVEWSAINSPKRLKTE